MNYFQGLSPVNNLILIIDCIVIFFLTTLDIFSESASLLKVFGKSTNKLGQSCAKLKSQLQLQLD
jgi:hypothetical protein